MSNSALSGRRWTMVVDLDRCTGCQACVVACHAENNVPTVGPELVAMGRSQHWLRIERYWEGEYPDIRARYMPVLCQQCQRAPCEPVCPVFATYHSDVQSLNIQAYNRCVGTRYCANNCPYLARMFNWFDPYFPEPLPEQLNPDVTVRYRGVMEKCTFCIQRIHKAEDRARAEGRSVRDGEVLPACAQVCPSDAITFGNIQDPESQVARLAASRRALTLLEDLGTEPSVIYLKGGASYAG
jgi:Fe-S-cluster-containing dehydrogenase component